MLVNPRVLGILVSFNRIYSVIEIDFVMAKIVNVYFLLLLALLAHPLNAEVYKHIDASGKTVFSDAPIGDAEKVEIRESNIVESASPRFALETIYKESCPLAPLKSKICSIEVIEKRSDFAMIRVHYHYVKGQEHSNKVVAKANKGSHDNVVGTKGGFDLIEGDNIIEIPLGVYAPGVYSAEKPYMSEYIMVEAKGLTEDGKRYTKPHIFRIFAKYKREWFTHGNNSSWQ